MYRRKVLRQQFANRTFLVQEEPRGPSQLIEIPVTVNGSSQINIPDVPELRSDLTQTIIIKALRCIPLPVLSNAPILGFANAPLTELVKISLVIYCEGWQKGKNIPITTLIDTFVEGSGFPWKDRTVQLADWQDVDWNKSYLQFSNGTVSAGQPYAVLLEVEYVRIDLGGNEIVGPA